MADKNKTPRIIGDSSQPNVGAARPPRDVSIHSQQPSKPWTSTQPVVKPATSPRTPPKPKP